ncbi:uncharacterized protein LOC113279644 [Papaver somniferum]|uniref:uncharacterized protein LOC113279644 n=1 Tax=Papaver somniferum TaxID=3469 RepID=UPI000E6F4ABC|nr:uncharacterized protein LOC113279644 [Papaver somniferum]
MGMKVQALIKDGNWCVPLELQQYIHTANLPTIKGGSDQIVWIGGSKNKFSTTDAVEKIREKEVILQWPKYIWKHFLHPSIASNIWKLQQKVYVDDEIMRNRGYEMVSFCYICAAEQDSMNHTLWKCQFSSAIWSWLNSVFGFANPASFEEVCKAAKTKSSMIKQIWMTAACATMKELWFQRNAKLFEEKTPNLNRFKCRIMQLVYEGGYIMNGVR